MILSISSVSSSSILWEEYLEKLKKSQQQTQEAASTVISGRAKADGAVDLSPDKLLAELESLQDDPEQLKARAEEMASQAAAAAASSQGWNAGKLKKLAADLQEVANSGDLSAIQEKVSRGGPMSGGIGGPSGIASKSLEELLEEEEDDDSEIDRIEELLAQIAALFKGTRDASSGEIAGTAGSPLEFGALVSKFQHFQANSAAESAETSTEEAAAAGQEYTVGKTVTTAPASGSDIISDLKTILSNQLRSYYANGRMLQNASSVSLAG